MKNRKSEDGIDRGVSEVISVVLMVAVTVVLAAVIGTVVMEIGQDVQPNVQAGVNVDFDTVNHRVTVTYTTNQDSDTTLSVDFRNQGTGTDSYSNPLTNIGDTITYSGTANDKVQVVVTASDGDRSTVVYDTTAVI